ncbi:MAG: YfhO family protein [Halioglobus sp.]
MNEELQNGGNLIDHWVPYWSLGYPVFHHYQYFPHLATLGANYLLLDSVPLFHVYHGIIFFLLLTFPLNLFFSLKRLEFPSQHAFAAAVLSLAIVSKDGYGLEMSSYTWSGFGMYAQLWAMYLFPITLACMYRTVITGRNFPLAILMLWLLSISQMLFGLAAAITSVIFLFRDLDIRTGLKRFRRLVIIGLGFLACIAYFVLPLFLDSPYHARSLYDSMEKFDSYGLTYIFSQIVSGQLFDYGRLPVFTVLCVSGALLCLPKRPFFYRFAVIGFVLWLALYLGRPTWGSLLDVMPLSGAIHFHRLVALVDFFGILTAGICLAELFLFLKLKSNFYIATTACVLLLIPVAQSMHKYREKNDTIIKNNIEKIGSDNEDLASVIQKIKSMPDGRVHPGRRANWGNEFKVGDVPVFHHLSNAGISAVSYLPFSWATTADYSLNFNEYRQDHFDMFNVKYLLLPESRPAPVFATEILKKGQFHLYKIATTGFFKLVESPMALYGNKESIWHWNLEWLRSPLPGEGQFMSIYLDDHTRSGYQNSIFLKDRLKFERHDEVASEPPATGLSGEKSTADRLESSNIFARDTQLFRPNGPARHLGELRDEFSSKNHYAVTAEVVSASVLLFKMTYHPLWQARVNGQLTDTMMLSPGLTGIKLEPGEHRIELRYSPRAWKMNLLLLSLVMLITLGLFERKKWLP